MARNKAATFGVAETAERLRKPESGAESGVENPTHRALAQTMSLEEQKTSGEQVQLLSWTAKEA